MVAQVESKIGEVNSELVALFDHLLAVKTSVLELRNQYQLSPKESMALTYVDNAELSTLWGTPGSDFILQKLANATSGKGASEGVSFLAGKHQYHAVLSIKVDKEAELNRMKEELAYYQGFVSSVDKKLSNEKFVSNAKAEVVENERKKKADGEAKIEQLLRSIANLN